MTGFNGKIRDVGGERGELDGGAASACAKGEEGEVAWRRESGGNLSQGKGQVEDDVPITCWFGSSRKTEW